ncbi:Uncharacterised protein [Mycobacteroides abscessus subsp. abscessus]|nr:Uncharacterised protein [Mycobacteroides abscessus subsp. abscessus]
MCDDAVAQLAEYGAGLQYGATGVVVEVSAGGLRRGDRNP